MGISNFYLCGYCKYGTRNANGDIACTRWAGPMSCRGGNGGWQPKVMFDHHGVGGKRYDEPRDVCEHYERRGECPTEDD